MKKILGLNGKLFLNFFECTSVGVILSILLSGCTAPAVYQQEKTRVPVVEDKVLVRPAIIKKGHSLNKLPETIIRVGIIENTEMVHIFSAGEYEVVDTLTSKKIILEKNVVYSVIPMPQGIKVGDYFFSAQIRFIPLSDGFGIKVNKRRYRDNIVVIKNGRNKLNVINELGIEGYVCGIMTQEVSPSWPKESLKAQAVVAKTYALKHLGKHKGEGFDVCATTHCQVFSGIDSEDPRSNQAVYETWGQVIVYKNELAKTFCHSSCGGHTESESGSWGGASSSIYLRGVTCGFCRDAPHYNWKKDLSFNEIKSTLNSKGYKVGDIKNISVLTRNSSGRVSKVKILHKQGVLELTGSKFRTILGPQVIRSSLFSTRKIGGNKINFYGRGWGHGVGFCQWGSRGMALRGYNYKQIIRHYYPHTLVERWGD